MELAAVLYMNWDKRKISHFCQIENVSFVHW